MTEVTMDAMAKGVARSGTQARPRRPLSIAFLIEALTTPGGTERQCIELARHLKKSGHHVVVLTLEGSLAAHEPDEIDSSIPLILIGRRRLAWLLGRLHPKLGQLWEMIRLGMAARRFPRSMLLVPHHYPAHWAAFVAGLLGRRTVIWLCNDWIYHPLPTRQDPAGTLRALRRRAMIAADGFIARHFAAVLALSRMTAAQIAQGYRTRTAVFRTGATGAGAGPASTRDRVAVREALEFPPEAYLVSCVCILMPHRRVDDVIRALARLRGPAADRTYFVHIGEASDRKLLEHLQVLAHDYRVAKRTRFLGTVPETVRRGIVAASDVLVFPVEAQSWGLAPLEAMAAGVPTIVSTSSGVAEVLRSGRDALLYEPGDIDTLASLFTRLCDAEDEATRLGWAGHRRWATRFTWPRAAARFARHLARYDDPQRS